MYKFHIPWISDKVLFEAVLEPSENIGEASGEGENKSEGHIRLFWGGNNRVAVGEPYYEDLISILKRQKQEIPHEIQKSLDFYDFHFVSLSCSFLPDNRCRFVWARFGVELRATFKETNESLKKRPIAYDMFPDEVTTTIKYSRDIHISPKIKFDIGVIKTDLQMGEGSNQKEFLFYEPQVIAFGIGRPTVVWQFQSTMGRGVWGNKRDLILIVKTPKNSKVKGRFFIGAEVEANGIRIPFAKRKDDIVDVEYDLTR